MDITLENINIYLNEVKAAIRNNRYRIELNSHRQDNRDLFLTYVLDEAMAKDILLGLKANNFSEVLQNEHRGFEYELLYVFGTEVELLERMGNTSRTVPLYIKFNKVDDCYVIVVSFHEQRYPINYYFE